MNGISRTELIETCGALQAQLEQLKAENVILRAELAALRGGAQSVPAADEIKVGDLVTSKSWCDYTTRVKSILEPYPDTKQVPMAILTDGGFWRVSGLTKVAGPA